MASGGLTRVSGLLLPKAQGHPVAYLVLGLSAVTSEDAHTVCAAWIAKAIAGRPKDVEFCRALIARSIVTCRRLRERLAKLSGLDRLQRADRGGRGEISCPPFSFRVAQRQTAARIDYGS